MKTLLIELTKELNIDQYKKGIDQAAQILRDGGTVAFPTETVYGIGANALSQEAISQIFTAKGRPDDNPLIVHVPSVEAVAPLVADINQTTKRLMEAFWPGPLTLIMKKSDRIPASVTAGLETVGVRVPSHPVAMDLLEAAGIPVAAPSANLSGKPSPTKGSHVVRDLDGRVHAIVWGDDSQIGLESTVVDVTTDVPMILRPGGITLEALREIAPETTVDPAIDQQASKALVPRSPGMKYTHYAPKADLRLFVGESGKVIAEIQRLQQALESEGKTVGILTSEEHAASYKGDHVLTFGSKVSLETVAGQLFHCLRTFDETQVDVILAEGVERKGLGVAIMNRLLKAAGNQMTKVQ